MAVMYEVVEDMRKNSKTKGQFCGRAVITDTVDLDQISREIESNVSVKQSDVYGVLIELVNVMTRHLQNGHRVKLDRFGSFKVGLKTKYAAKREDFTASKNIVGSRLNFQPEVHWSAADGGKHVRAFLSGLAVRPYERKKASEEQDPAQQGEG